MKKLLLLLFGSVLALGAAEISYKNGPLELVFETKGGSVKTLLWGKHRLSWEGERSFTERLMSNSDDGKSQLQEYFNDLEFTSTTAEKSWRGLELSFSTRGIGAFDWLRLTKTYRYKQNDTRFFLDYKLENLDAAPHSVALWCQTFLRDCQTPETVNVFVQGEHEPYSHPGNPAMDDWMLDPAMPFTAFYGKESGKGALIALPYEVVDSFYNWSDRQKYMSTVEFLTRVIGVEAGKNLAFTVSVTLGDGIPKKLEALRGRQAGGQPGRLGERLVYPMVHAVGKEHDVKLVQCRGGNTVVPSKRSMTLVVPRQCNDSVRELVLPDDANPASTSVYEVHNGVADRSREVPSAIGEAGGKKVLRFLVPGFHYDFYGLKLDKDRNCYHVNHGYLGPADYAVEIQFDQPSKGTFDAARLNEGNLFDNVDFKRLDKDGRPQGWVLSKGAWNRKWLSMEEGALVMRRPSEKDQYVQFGEHVMLEPLRKYCLEVEISNDNSIKGTAAGSIWFFDANGKLVPDTKTAFYNGTAISHGWRTFRKEFYAPEKAVAAHVVVIVYGVREQKISFRRVSLKAEPYASATVKLVDRLRDQLTSNWYKPLDFIERNDTDVETPHEAWLKPAAFDMPEVLFLPLNKGCYASMERRRVVELAQRMSLKYTIISLLERVSFIAGDMGVCNVNNFAGELEPYTIERLREAPKSKVVVVTDVNFKQDVKEPFLNFLRERLDTTDYLFMNCLNVPEEFLGKAVDIPEELQVLPVLARYPNIKNVVSVFERKERRTACLDLRLARQVYFPSVPPSESYNMYPGYVGRDFPYWEFKYLTFAKLLRHVAGVMPDAVIKGVKDGNVILMAKKAMTVQLKTRFDNLYRQTLGVDEKSLALKEGLNSVALTLPRTGGDCVAYLKLFNGDRILDAAGAKLTVPDAVNLKVTFPKGTTLPFGQPLPVEIRADGAENLELEAVVEDTDFRQLFARTQAGGALSFNFNPGFPRTVMYRLLVAVRSNGAVLARQVHELSFAGVTSEPDELIAVVWPGSNTLKYPIWKKLGFEHFVIGSDGRREYGAVRALKNINAEPAIYGLGGRGFPNWRPYKLACKDTVRTPCFSDEAVWEKARAEIAKQASLGNYAHYDVKYHFMGDELFIGNNVCYSPHCLKNFRELMAKQYGTVGRLNAAWGTAFESFDSVMPQQMTELKDKAKLGPFVDHKQYICSVFADVFMGGVARELKKAAPASVIGLSGTDKPGYSFDWGLVMRHLDYLACYDGSQRKLARDFAKPGAIIGQWFGGYVLPTPHEGYINSFFWRDLLQGGRMSPNWTPRAGITGDLKLTPQLEYHSRLIKEVRNGIAKLILNSTEKPMVAMVYSQSSLFAAAATIGLNEYQNSLEGWHALLGDLGIDYKFIYAPELPQKLNQDYKVLILPGMLSASDAEMNAIRDFASKGGTVLADMVPGVYDEHGTLRSGKNVPSIVSRTYDGGAFRCSDAQLPVMAVEKVGKGSFTTFNLLVAGYQQIVLGGIGGETSSVKSGTGMFCEAMRKLVTVELEKAGVRRNRILTGKDGKPRQAETVWKDFNGCKLFGIWNFNAEVASLKPQAGETITVKLPEKGHVYNLRTGAYVAHSDSFDYQLYPGGADVFAVLKDKPGKLKVQAAKTLNRGEELGFSVKLPGCGRVFHCELLSPEGKPCYQRNLAAPDGNASGAFQLALNDSPGNWTLVINDAATRTMCKSTVLVK